MHTTDQRLMRSRSERIIAGVAGGIGQYLAIDPLITRLIFIFLIFSGVGPPLYIVLWIIMPNAPETAEHPDVAVRPGARFDPMTGEPLNQPHQPHTSVQRNWTLGMVLVVVGSFLFLSVAIPWIYPYLLPILFIGAGLLLLRRAQ
jgi:phage shock protein C